MRLIGRRSETYPKIVQHKLALEAGHGRMWSELAGQAYARWKKASTEIHNLGPEPPETHDLTKLAQKLKLRPGERWGADDWLLFSSRNWSNSLCMRTRRLHEFACHESTRLAEYDRFTGISGLQLSTNLFSPEIST